VIPFSVRLTCVLHVPLVGGAGRSAHTDAFTATFGVESVRMHTGAKDCTPPLHAAEHGEAGPAMYVCG
jgi:hypothetical protein